MEKQVIFRDRQELQSADLNNIEEYAADSLQHLTQDAVTINLAFAGGITAAASATEITVAPVRFYNNGLSYIAETAQTLNLFQYLPLVTKKCVAVIVWGSEVDTLVEPRDFLIDLTTGATQPQAVAMLRLQSCNVNLLPGAESADPQPPVIQNGTLAIAYVYLTPTGIDHIVMQDASRLPQLADHAARLATLETWKAIAEPRIASIATDLAALTIKTDGKADRESIIQLANDIAALKQSQVTPANAVTTTPNYGDANQSGVGESGYSARVVDGILFPFAASQTVNLALFNPIDPAVAVSAANSVLPAYTSVERLKTSGYSGDVAISSYQSQALVITKFKPITHTEHYGPNINNHKKWYSRHGWDNHGYLKDFETPNFGSVKIKPKDDYELEQTTTNISGAMLAQTVLIPNAMWLTQVGLSFSQVAGSGDVTLAVTEVTGGKPNLGRALALVTVTQANLKSYPEETNIAIPPVFLRSGQRYAIVAITQGNHRLALVSGGANTQGQLFYGQDSDYNVQSTNDLLFTLYAASFSLSRTVVNLQALSLTNGMTDIRIDVPEVIPKGCELFYEIQPSGSGAWYPLGDPTLRLAAAPNLVNLRAVFLGTKDLQPALVLTNNAITVSRSDTAIVYFSTARTVASTTSIVLSSLISNWDNANHTLTPKIIVGGTEYAASVTTYTLEDGARRYKHTFSVPAATSYKVKVSGTRTAGAQPFSIVELIDSTL
jgi:hypothetical protein